MISSRYKYENLQNIKMRYLSYDNDYNGKSFDLLLRYPEYLVSLSIQKVKISNIRMCTNLRNLISLWSTYESADILPLKNLCGFYSFNDNYEKSNNCLLHDLFRSKNLEYVYIYSRYCNSNVINSLIINKNIENLRFMFIY